MPCLLSRSLVGGDAVVVLPYSKAVFALRLRYECLLSLLVWMSSSYSSGCSALMILYTTGVCLLFFEK